MADPGAAGLKPPVKPQPPTTAPRYSQYRNPDESLVDLPEISRFLSNLLTNHVGS